MKIDFHVHPHFENYSSKALVDAISNNNIDVVGLAGYNEDRFDEYRREIEKLNSFGFLKVTSDDLAIKAEDEYSKDKHYFPRIGEWETEEGFHMLVLGNQQNIKQKGKIVENIEKALESESLVVIDHSFVGHSGKGLFNQYADISKEQEKILYSLCKKYDSKIALEWNGYNIPSFRKSIGFLSRPFGIEFSDINKKLEDFEIELQKEDINCPIIADSDVHARSAKDLDLIGKANIEMKDEIIASGKHLQTYLIKKIFNREYKSNKEYVPGSHFIFSYAIPAIAGSFSEKLKAKIKPRG